LNWLVSPPLDTFARQMPDEEQTAGGSQSPYDAGVQRSADANAPPHLNTLEGRGRDPSLEHLKNMRDQAALEEDAAHLEQFRNYQSGFSNDARSTGDDSAPPNADYNYNNDFAVDGNYPKSSKRRTPRQQEQNKHVRNTLLFRTHVAVLLVQYI
jgi:hypothetical protein